MADRDWVRLSVTDRCNLRCVYCMPPEGVPPRSHDEILSYEELLVFAAAALLDRLPRRSRSVTCRMTRAGTATCEAGIFSPEP